MLVKVIQNKMSKLLLLSLLFISLNSIADSIAYYIVIETPHFICTDTMYSIESVDYFVDRITGISGISCIFNHSDYFELKVYGMIVYCEMKKITYNRRGIMKLKRIK